MKAKQFAEPTPTDKLEESFSMVSDFVLECRGQGLVLPSQDARIIYEWIQSAPTLEALILTLDEILPNFFSKKLETRRIAPSLRGVHQKVLKRLRDQGARAVRY